MGLKVVGLFVVVSVLNDLLYCILTLSETLKYGFIYYILCLLMNLFQKYTSLCLSFDPVGAYSWDVVAPCRRGQQTTFNLGQRKYFVIQLIICSKPM